jgi:hypothetical protein
MNTIQVKALSAGLFFLFIFLSGFWLSGTGKPYNSGIFNIHKLIGLAAGIFLILTVSRVHKVEPLSSIQIIVLVFTVLIFVCLVAAGGLLSVQAQGGLSKISPFLLNAIGGIHKTFPYLAVFSTAATLYVLLFRKG